MRDLINQKFGKLKVLKKTQKRKWGCVVWLCKCDCGNIIEATGSGLVTRNTKSCGCLRKEKLRQRLTTHGHSIKGNWSKTYTCWHSMKQRCLNENHKNYKNYGGRGIMICERWKDSFKNFLADMGVPSEGMSIDRIDNDGNYELSNCRWSTPKEQANNRSNNIILVSP